MTEMQELPAQFSMAASSPLAHSGYELVALDGGDERAEWQVVGDDSQLLLAVLNPGQSIMSEPGGMLTTSDFIEPDLDMGGVGLACQRCCCAQESCCRTHYKNNTQGRQHITLSPAFPAKVVPLKMDKHPQGFFLSKGAWMAGIGANQEFGVAMAPSLLVACCACQGCCITTFKGSGDAFINAGGTVLQRTLKPGEKVVVDTFALVAWEATVTLDVKTVGDCFMSCFGGSGIFNTELTGPGLVIIHSMGFERVRAAVMKVLETGTK